MEVAGTSISGGRGRMSRRASSPKRAKSPKRASSPKRAKSPTRRLGMRKHKKGGNEMNEQIQENEQENEVIEAVGGGSCGVVGGKRGASKKASRSSRSRSPVKHRKPRRKGGSEENPDEDEMGLGNGQNGAGRKRKHKRMCARKLSPYNLFVKKRMCELRKQTKSPVVVLFKQIAAEWKSKK